MVLLALETGARRGELLGLRPESLEDNAILIRESISPTSKDTELKGKLQVQVSHPDKPVSACCN